MTLMRKLECKCSVCGGYSEHSVLFSTYEEGSPGLDFRPSPESCYLMSSWVEECPHCGYVNYSIKDPSGVTEDWLNSEEYLTCDGIAFESKLAVRFYRHYKYNEYCNLIDDAAEAIRNAAWVCDDCEDDENAKRCRKIAIPLYAKLIEKGYGDSEKLMVIKADMLRRAGEFQQLIDEYSDISFEDEELNKIIDFQLKRAKKEDDRCYTMDMLERTIYEEPNLKPKERLRMNMQVENELAQAGLDLFGYNVVPLAYDYQKVIYDMLDIIRFRNKVQVIDLPGVCRINPGNISAERMSIGEYLCKNEYPPETNANAAIFKLDGYDSENNSDTYEYIIILEDGRAALKGPATHIEATNPVSLTGMDVEFFKETILMCTFCYMATGGPVITRPMEP